MEGVRSAQVSKETYCSSERDLLLVNGGSARVRVTLYVHIIYIYI